jgi:hypothetical protein
MFQAERGIFDTLSFFHLFKKIKEKIDQPESENFQKRDLYMLIPVLREQSIIEKTVLDILQLKNYYFNIRVIVITTIREKMDNPYGQPPLTSTIILDSLENGKLKEFKENISLIEETDAEGNMATQLNFAIRSLSSIAPPESLYLLYNADSVISPKTFASLGKILQETPSTFAFQQPCAYVKDLKTTSPPFLNALAIYQSWYCLGHESSLIRKYEEYTTENSTFPRLSVIVGHGSGMTLGTNIQNGGYPTDLLTEDLTFGFILSTKSVPICLLSSLEVADVPEKFTDFVKQKSVWFWNYLGYFSCYEKMLQKGFSRKKLLPLLFQGLGGGAYWFFSGIFILAPIFIGIFSKSIPILVIAITSSLLFSILPQYMLFKKLPSVLEEQGLEKIANNISGVSFFKISPWIFLIAITDSLGPWIASFRYIVSLVSGSLPKKYKTGD